MSKLAWLRTLSDGLALSPRPMGSVMPLSQEDTVLRIRGELWVTVLGEGRKTQTLGAQYPVQVNNSAQPRFAPKTTKTNEDRCLR